MFERISGIAKVQSMGKKEPTKPSESTPFNVEYPRYLATNDRFYAGSLLPVGTAVDMQARL